MKFRVRQSRASDVVGSEGDLPNYTTMSRITLSGWAAIGWGLVTAVIGSIICLAAAGLIGGTKHAPDWVIWAGGIVFVVGGVTMCSHGIFGLVIASSSRRDVMLHPDEEWRGDYVWSVAAGNPGMKSRESGWWMMTGLGMLIVVCFTMVSTWVSVTGPGGMTGAFLWFMSGFMYFCFVICTLVFLSQLISALRYGTPRMVYETMPVGRGEILKGRVRCPRGFGSLDRITICLRHVEEYYEQRPRSGKKSATKVSCRGKVVDKWVIDDVQRQLSDPMSAGADAGFGSGEIPIAFLLPENAADTQASERPASFWDLEVRGEAKGVDFVHRFAVPVYSGGVDSGGSGSDAG
ncbi:MAG: hypothetical protein AB8C13_08215 [Phycisphaerales bacterium]